VASVDRFESRITVAARGPRRAVAWAFDSTRTRSSARAGADARTRPTG
jgi:hypothetical protein